MIPDCVVVIKTLQGIEYLVTTLAVVGIIL
jgi:hypothetical protein